LNPFHPLHHRPIFFLATDARDERDQEENPSSRPQPQTHRKRAASVGPGLIAIAPESPVKLQKSDVERFRAIFNPENAAPMRL
jgi:hypothetical protein